MYHSSRSNHSGPRDDLFAPKFGAVSNYSTSRKDNLDSARPESRAENISVMGDASKDADCMQLEHIYGFTGEKKSTLFCHPIENSVIIYSIGSVLCLEDNADAHRQEFLRGHDAEISGMAVSSNGELIATGQVCSSSRAGHYAPIIVWDFKSRLSVYILEGFTHKVSTLSFSPDGAFLAASGGLDGLVMVWEMQTGELVATQKSPKGEVSLLTWGSSTQLANKRRSYKLIIGFGSKVVINILEWNIRSVQYVLKSSQYGLPSSGLVRNFTTAISNDNDELIAGTMAGEFCVFNNSSKIYRQSVPVSSNGVLSIAHAASFLFLGSGNGSIKKFYGSDVSWAVEGEVVVDGKVTSLSLAADKKQLFAGTDMGHIYRISTVDMSVTRYASSATGCVRALAFGKSNDLFASVSADGILRVWDLGDYSVLMATPSYNSGGRCVVFAPDDDTIITGWDDASIRCHTVSSSTPRFHIPNAHRGAVLSVAVSSKYIVSGGEDGRVRVWNRKGTHSVILEFAEHRKPVTGVSIDINLENIIHSCSSDRTVLSYDLITERRKVIHMVPNSGCTTLSQRTDAEFELVTGCTDGKIYFWDIDISDPTMVIQDPSCSRLYSAVISPTGQYIAVCGDDQLVKIYQSRDGTLLAAGHVHGSPVRNVQWTPDEKQLVSCASDCSIAVWNFFGLE